MKKLFLICVSSLAIGGSTLAAYLQPVVYYGSDPFGQPLTNSFTISTWPPTNAITGFGSNIIGNVSYTFTPALITNGSVVTAFWSNNITPGNYRIQIQGYTLGVPFGIYSNATAINIAQVANLPITSFMNFTLAQFSDAGTMAREATNNWTRNGSAFGTNIPVLSRPITLGSLTNSLTTNSDQTVSPTFGLSFAGATNSFAGITNALGYMPPTNSFAGITNALGYKPPTNSFAGITNALGYQPPTNLAPVVIVGTTNHITFGSTNPPPVSTNVIFWISVQVAGDTNSYRLGLTK